MPEIAADEVLIRVRSCGICGTDLHIHEGEFLAAFPLIPGHEFAGEVISVGTAVKSVQIGERVVADNTELCGHCFLRSSYNNHSYRSRTTRWNPQSE